MSAVPLASKIKVAMLVDGSGNALDSSRVTIQFSEGITLVDPTKLRLFGYGLVTATGTGLAQQKITIKITSAVAGADGNKIVLTTDRRVRKGANFSVADGGITNASDGTSIGAQTALLPKGLNKERFTLACRSFVPTQFQFFDPSLFPSGTALSPTPSVPTESSVTTQLTAYLTAEVADGIITSAQMTQALGVYNSTSITSEFPSPNIRAGLASLVGTFAEGAIDSYTTSDNASGKPFTVVDFSSEVSNAATIAETTGNVVTKRIRTLFKNSYKGENFLALAPILAHEAVRQDMVGADPNLPDGINESEVAVSFETLLWSQELLVTAAPASAHTALSTHLNEDLLSMLNSGLALYPRVGELNAPLLSGNALPKSDPTDAMGVYTSFENYIRRTYTARGFMDVETPGNAYAQTAINKITGGSLSGTYTFSSSLITALDNSQQIIGDKAAVALAHILRLDISR